MSKSLVLTALIAAAFILPGCGGSGTTTNVTSRTVSATWTQELLDSISNINLGPPATARAIALTHTAMFDAWAAYDATAIGVYTRGTLRRPTVERTLDNKEIAISYAAYRVLINLYPARTTVFRNRMIALGFNPDNASLDTSTPVGIGNMAAQMLINGRQNDGSNQYGNLAPGAYSDTTGYVPVNTPDVVNDPSQWQPLRFANGATPKYIAPHWGNVTPFAVTNLNSYLQGGPPAYGSPAYLNEIEEVISATENLNDRSKVIAEYWANGPRTTLPPGHWMEFGLWVADRDNMGLDEEIKMMFALGNAMMDSSIVCWHNKRTYNSSRPITAIRDLFPTRSIVSFDHATKTLIAKPGAQWLPYQDPNFITPPFPEYISGHSTFSAAGAEILKRATGSDNFGYSVTFQPGSMTFEANVPSTSITLSYPTFTVAADESGLSRIYGGIHIPSGNTGGLQCGRDVADAVWDLAQQYIDGTAP